MAFDWLFGPNRIDRSNQIVTRSLVLEPDTVREVAAMVKHHYGEVHICFHPVSLAADSIVPTLPLDPSAIEAVDLDRLASEADWRIRRLAIHGSSNFVVDLRAGVRPTISFMAGEPGVDRLAERVFEKLNKEGRPVVIWSRFIAWLAPAAVLLLVGAWVWYLATGHPALSLAIAGSVLVLFAALAGRGHYRTLENLAVRRYPGHRLRTLDRKEIRLRRADRHANLRVGLITALVGAAVSAGLIWGLHLY
jgi:hypothetical protein